MKKKVYFAHIDTVDEFIDSHYDTIAMTYLDLTDEEFKKCSDDSYEMEEYFHHFNHAFYMPNAEFYVCRIIEE